MSGALYVLLVTAATGVQFGWKPLDDGGREYIVQVEPQLVDSLFKEGKEGFTSEVPPDLRDIRRIRIVVGNGSLPNQGVMTIPHGAGPLAATESKAAAAPKATTAAKIPTGLAGDSLPLPGPAETRDPPSPPPKTIAAATQPLASTGDATKPPSLPAGSPKADANSRTVEKPSTDGPPPDPTPDPRAGQPWPNSIQPPPNDNSWPRHHDSAFDTTGPNGQRIASVDGVTGQRRSPSDESPAVGSAAEGPRPWLPLLGVSALLIVSVAGNVYLGWSYLGARNRYLEVVDELHGQPHIIDAPADEDAVEPSEEDAEEQEAAPPRSIGKPGSQPPPLKK